MACCRGLGPRQAKLALADVLRVHALPATQLGRDQARVVRDILSCRTAALGGHLEKCDQCGHEIPVYNSCRNRHCPTCQSFESVRWVEGQTADLLPVPYFHLVFTIPTALHPFFLLQRKLALSLLFAAVAKTVIELCRERLGATPGMLAVLHTWTQLMLLHPHIHCIVTGGGISLDGARWIASRPWFFLPVRKLSSDFRRNLIAAFDAAITRGQFAIATPAARNLLRRARATPWVVYAKAPMAGPEQVLRYLGRYTHRCAIGNERIVDDSEGKVTFTYRDRQHGNRRRRCRLPGSEFVRRFLLHVLPHRFVRIRHYGILANAFKHQRLDQARGLLDAPAPPEAQLRAADQDWADLYLRLTGVDPRLCPACRRGTLRVVALIPPVAAQPIRAP